MKSIQHITLRRLFIENQSCIGLKFYANKAINIIIKELNDIQWSTEFTMYYVPNNKTNIDQIFSLFKGIAWIDTQYFYEKSRAKALNETFDASWVKTRVRPNYFKFCPDNYLQKLELKKYANNTVKTYVSCFEDFLNYYSNQDVNTLDENDVRNYLEYLYKSFISLTS